MGKERRRGKKVFDGKERNLGVGLEKKGKGDYVLRGGGAGRGNDGVCGGVEGKKDGENYTPAVLDTHAFFFSTPIPPFSSFFHPRFSLTRSPPFNFFLAYHLFSFQNRTHPGGSFFLPAIGTGRKG